MKNLFFTLVFLALVSSSYAQIEINNFTAYTQTVVVQYEDLSNPCVVLTWQGNVAPSSSVALPVASNTRALTASTAPVISGCSIFWSRSNRPAYYSIGPCPTQPSMSTGKAKCNGSSIPSWSVVINGTIPVGPGSSININ